MFDNFRVRLASLAPLPLRIALAATFMIHGWPKIMTLANGGNPVAELVANWPAPQLWGWAAGLTEFVGGACILLGLLTRFWSAGLVIQMGVAISAIHARQGFKVHAVLNDGKPMAAGFEWQLSLAMIALALFLMGPGALSLDYFIGRRFRGQNANAVIGCGARLPTSPAPPGQQ